MNRPEVLNALSPDLLDELTAAAAVFDEDPAIGWSVITGNGARLFRGCGHRRHG
ncbi:MAG: enoyl-CoA hydratase-related protein [Caldilineaceae bacterium]